MYMSIIRPILKEIQVGQIMIKPVITVHQEDEFHVVQEKMETYHIRHLPVINDSGKLVGIITQRILYKTHSPRKLEDGWYYDIEALDRFILRNVMNHDPYTLPPNGTLEEAMQTMSQLKIGCVIIIDEDRVPRGILTRDDILRFLLTQ